MWHEIGPTARGALLTIDILNVPYVDDEQRIEVMQRAPGYWHGIAQYGFMEHPAFICCMMK
jgi:K+ transporter